MLQNADCDEGSGLRDVQQGARACLPASIVGRVAARERALLAGERLRFLVVRSRDCLARASRGRHVRGNACARSPALNTHARGCVLPERRGGRRERCFPPVPGTCRSVSARLTACAPSVRARCDCAAGLLRTETSGSVRSARTCRVHESDRERRARRAAVLHERGLRRRRALLPDLGGRDWLAHDLPQALSALRRVSRRGCGSSRALSYLVRRCRASRGCS